MVSSPKFLLGLSLYISGEEKKGGKKERKNTENFIVENYVWYFVDKMYGNQWGWTGNGNSYPQRKRQLERDTDHIARQAAVQADALDLGDESTDPSTYQQQAGLHIAMAT